MLKKLSACTVLSLLMFPVLTLADSSTGFSMPQAGFFAGAGGGYSSNGTILATLSK